MLQVILDYLNFKVVLNFFLESFRTLLHHLKAGITLQKGETMMEGLVELLNNLKNTIDALTGQIGNLKIQLDDAKKAVDEAAAKAYAEGFAAGVESVPKSDKLYSQEEADSMVKAAVEPLQLQVSELLGKVEELNGQIPVMIEEAKVSFKAELLAKYEEAQVVESQAETGFVELLK